MSKAIDQLKLRQRELMIRLNATKKGPAWTRRVKEVEHLMNDMMTEVDELNEYIIDTAMWGPDR